MADNGPDPTLVVSVFARECTSRALFEDVTGKWASLVLLALDEGPRRFGELRRRVEGVSEKMLSQALKTLEGGGMVARTAHPQSPPRVDYELTELGAQVAARLRGLALLLEDTAAARLSD
ncbi:winged helix-turn-helix transcriptional regulator [Demequina aestuarii]|uniref:winged helix-turn-helix transcriptional regulator n=1 Tax=Demequina aestuarii TaxID=327095 RepID=UPI000781F6DC|nr:helix-turn-helix domain-containing protein [Demequina aestuarii]